MSPPAPAPCPQVSACPLTGPGQALSGHIHLGGDVGDRTGRAAVSVQPVTVAAWNHVSRTQNSIPTYTGGWQRLTPPFRTAGLTTSSWS